MKLYKFGTFTLLVLNSVYFLGCDSLRQEVNPDRLNREAAKLVVTCFLSPQDTVLAVKVTRSQPVLGNGVNVTDSSLGLGVTDATVTLSEAEGGRSARLDFNNMPHETNEIFPYYSVSARQLPIVVGHTYTLTVQTPAGERATSTCTVPGPVAITSVSLDSVTENQFGRQFKRYFVRSRWLDPASQINYYQVSGVFRFLRVCQNCPTTQTQQREEFTYLRFNGNSDFSDNNGTLLTDRTADGGIMLSGRGFLGSYFDNGGNAQPGFGVQYKTATVTMNLLNADQAYYQYQDAVERQSQVSGNPFAEPVPVPTNIQGALGCFGAYNRSSLTIRLK